MTPKQLFFYVLLIITIAISNCKGYPASDGERCYHSAFTNEYATYYPEYQLCCLGQIYQKNPNIYQTCCGASPYDSREEICCGHEILPNFMKCCNGQAKYNDTTHICCGLQVYQRKGEDDTCCGNHPMDRNYQTCCKSGARTWAPRNGLGHCCGTDKIYLPSTQICCEAGHWGDSLVHDISIDIRSAVECCAGGLQFYLPSAQLCCNGVPQNSGPHTTCCGIQTYDTLTQICCNERVVDINDGRNKCCGDVAFDPSVEQCCLFNVNPIANGKCCLDQAYYPSESSCCNDRYVHHGVPEIEGVQKCCDGVSYLETEKICCNGSLHHQQMDIKCCGKDLYNSTTHLCCRNDVVSRKSSTTQCCGGGGFEPDSETCCPEANRGFPNIVGGRCCFQHNGVVVAYDPRKATCCPGRGVGQLYIGVPTSFDDEQCCGEHLLRPAQELCYWRYNSGIPISKRKPDDDMVCFSYYYTGNPANTYNSRDEVCTSGGHVMLKDASQQLCGGNLYDDVSEICCQGRIYDKIDESGRTKRCCEPSINSYVEETQACCAGIVRDVPTDIAACCGNYPYDTTTHTCDNSGWARPIEEVQRYPNMCGPDAYHPDEHFCCEGQLADPGQTCCRGRVSTTGTEGLNTGKCCGGIGFNPETHLCCEEYVHTRENDGFRCCGDNVWDVDSTEDICCGGTFQHIQSEFGQRMNCRGQLAYNIHTETVCDGLRLQVSNGHCCGQGLFDPVSQICCNDNVFIKHGSDVQCCGNQAFDTTDRSILCCNHFTLHYQADGKQCCGNQAVDPLLEECCTITDNPYIYKISQRDETCCSSSTPRDTCCNGNLHLNIKDGNCCGNAIIRDSHQEVCCEGAKVNKESEYSVCCGQSVIDSRYRSCCNGKVINKDNQGCCNNQVINTNYEACCGTHSYYPNDPTQHCCIDTLYDPRLQGCCAHTLYSMDKFDCCAGVIYDEANEICQDGKIGVREKRQISVTEKPKSSISETPLMCNGFPYDETIDGCCGRVSYKKGDLSCCADKIYNPSTAVCCADKIRYKKNGACCGPKNKAYNSAKYVCCNGFIRSKSSSGPTACCKSKAFQNDTQLCCKGKVYDMSSNGQQQECCGNKVFSPEREICCKNSKVVDTVASYLVPNCYTKLYSLYDAASGSVSKLIDTTTEATVWVPKKLRRRQRGRVQI